MAIFIAILLAVALGVTFLVYHRIKAPDQPWKRPDAPGVSKLLAPTLGIPAASGPTADRAGVAPPVDSSFRIGGFVPL